MKDKEIKLVNHHRNLYAYVQVPRNYNEDPFINIDEVKHFIQTANNKNKITYLRVFIENKFTC